MAAINDWIVNIVNGVVTSFAVNFGAPLCIGLTGSRSIVTWGSGASAAVATSFVRGGAFSLTIIRSGSVYDYDLDSPNSITITVPTTARVRDLQTDFIANAPAPVKAIINEIKPTGTGSGLVTVLAETEADNLDYLKVIDISQIKYYYDATDKEYVIVNNVLASKPSPGLIYILDCYGLTGSGLTDLIDANNNGDWFVACTTSLDEAIQKTLTDHFDTLDRVLFLTVGLSAALARLALCLSGNVAFLVHDDPDAHPEASWFAKNLPFLPTVIYKGVSSLQGQLPNETSTLSGLIAIRDAKGNCYVKDSGVNLTDGGITTDPNAKTYIDQSISRKWLKINSILAMKDLFAQTVARGERIPYTDKGIQTVIAAVAAVFSRAGTPGVGVVAPAETPEQVRLSYDGVNRFQVRAATRAEIEANSPSDITDRRLRGITYTYVESGAIEGATITETIVLTEV